MGVYVPPPSPSHDLVLTLGVELEVGGHATLQPAAAGDRQTVTEGKATVKPAILDLSGD